MIEPVEAYDILAEFQTCDQIAQYLYNEGVTGTPNDSISCPIANFMRLQTGLDFDVTGDGINSCLDLGEEFSFYVTDAMIDFIFEFDEGGYSHLADPVYPETWH